ncbi:hypothetical protein E2C01_062005 [Portunus trituberculatus]|uniref:Uncharacterized protein n=1 Tax=Portunus trituberculatus TaxID=210409 RepID=A0A5B7HDD7_PORTR|nr:hypothetical protein [Portunus trituberculatus]
MIFATFPYNPQPDTLTAQPGNTPIPTNNSLSLYKLGSVTQLPFYLTQLVVRSGGASPMHSLTQPR